MYGNVFDKDIESKIKQLEQLKDKLYDSYKEEHSIIGDTYCYAIASERPVKKLVKTLSR